MNIDFVVDASIAGAWFLPDEATPYSEAALQATVRQNVWVPALWQLEMTNLLLSAQRRGRIDETKRRQLLAAAAALRVHVDHEPISMIELDRLAAQYALAAYDTAYLELALRRQLPIATADSALIAAMASAGVKLVTQ